MGGYYERHIRFANNDAYNLYVSAATEATDPGADGDLADHDGTGDAQPRRHGRQSPEHRRLTGRSQS